SCIGRAGRVGCTAGKQRASISGENAYGSGGSGKTSQERMRGVRVYEVPQKGGVIKVSDCGSLGSEGLRWSVALARGQDVISGDSPTAQRPAGKTMLVPEERQLFREQDRSLVGIIEAGERVL